MLAVIGQYDLLRERIDKGDIEALESLAYLRTRVL
jgi:hypothetical protein